MKHKFSKILVIIVVVILVLSITLAGIFNNLWLPSASINPENLPKVEGLITVPEDFSYPSTNSPAVKSINNIAFTMFKLYPKETNSIFSPAGLALSLGHLQNGASESARNEILALILNDDSPSKTNFSELNESYRDYIKYISNYDTKSDMIYGNSIWYESEGYSPPKEDFLKISNDYFYSEIYPQNFNGDPKGSMKKVNSWVQNKTNGCIKSIMNQVPKNFYMSLINTIYFKGTWHDEFKHKYTKNRPFTTLDGDIKTKTMFTNESLQYLKGDDFSAVRKHYKDRLTSMTIVLPNEDVTLEDFVSSIDTAWWDSLDSNINRKEVQLYLPKFKFDYFQMLIDPLKSNGIGKIFSEKNDPLINISPEFFVSMYKQKCFIRVDETGTEAAAVTSADNSKSESMKPITFKVDRPFLFLISDERTNSILFMGSVYDPSK